MYQLLKPLQEVAKKYLFEKKVIIVPSYLDGNTLRKNLSHEGFSALNFHSSTLFDLAKEICFDTMIKNRWKIMDSPLGQVMVLQILKKLFLQDKLTYFRLPIITPGLAKSIFRTIKEIRVSGYSSGNWPSDINADSGKMKDLYQIILDYEQELRNRNLIDEADLYALARRTTTKKDKSIYIVPSNMQMNELELQFFKEKIKPTAYLIELACPEATVAPHYFSLANIRSAQQCSEKKVFDFLYRSEKTPEKLPDLNIELYQAYGEYTETREVLRYIAEKGIPYDQVQVFYTTQEPYSQYFYELSDLYRIPVTFYSGVHIKNSHPAKLLFSLIDWINDNYSVAKLFSLFNSDNINLKLAEPLKVRELTSLLRQSPIGWGRNRYIPGIELAIRERERKIKNASEDNAQKYLTEIAYYQAIKDWIEKIFTEIPPSNFHYRVSLSAIARGFGNIINQYARIEKHNRLDEEAHSIIQEKMAMLDKNGKDEFSLSEALNLIADLINEVRICCSESHAGCLHMASYKKGIWMNRPYTFIVGMDSHKFPGNSDEGTIFLDTEKMFYQQLLTDVQKNRIEQYRLLQLILSTAGKTFLSFSCFDTAVHREQAPTSMLLQLYRLKEKDIGKSYNEFYQYLGEKRKLIPKNKSEILDKGDIFLYFPKQEKKDLQLIFQYEYPNFKKGIEADLERKKEEFNAYNGKIKVINKKIDPRQNRGIILSSSKLERIAYCPYLYFLTDVLKITPPEEMIYEPGQWMSPLERGLLLHQIYEKFYKILISISNGKLEPPSFARHWPILEKIVLENLEEKRKYLAPPGELIYQAEKRGILESCQMFLTGEEKNYQGEVPEFFELAFGTRDNEHKALGKVRAVELTLPDGEKISSQGKIDRIDRLPDNTFRIIDYKTGISRDYSKGKPFRHGQQIQHALYAIALEKILEKKNYCPKPEVSLSGYYFPTVQGQGRLVLYHSRDRGQVLQIIEILLNIVTQGNFAMTQKADDFMCRNYQDIMEQNEVIFVEGNKRKVYQDEPALNCVRRLQQFE